MAQNPIVLAGIGLGAAYLLTRARSADAAPPPSTQGFRGKQTVGVEAGVWRLGHTCEVLLPAKYGYVQPPMPAFSRPLLGADNKYIMGMPAFFASSHSGDFRLNAGQIEITGGFRARDVGVPYVKYRTRESSKRGFVIGVGSGKYAIPSVASLREYYGKFLGYSHWDSVISERFRWDVIPVGNQGQMYNDVISGEQFLVPDTELTSAQLQVRSAAGQLSAAYSVRNGTNISTREGFYFQGEAFVRTDGSRGSRNWKDITDEDPNIIYFVGESGLVALNKRTMRNAAPGGDWASLRPRWKGLPYGVVPMAKTPWDVSPFSITGELPGISGGFKRRDRNWWWSTNQDLPSRYGGEAPPPPANWRSYRQPATKRRVYPPSSAFVGGGVYLYKDKHANSAFGCRDNKCHLNSIINFNSSTIPLSGNTDVFARSGVFGGQGQAPFDFHAPAVLDAFVNTKLTQYRNDVRFSGDE